MDLRAGYVDLRSVELLWNRPHRIIPARNVPFGTRESLDIEMVRGCCWIRLVGNRKLI